MKQKLHKELQALFDFFQKQRQNRPESFTHGIGIINNPSFFTLQDLQVHLNNPLLRPEWIHVKQRGKKVAVANGWLYKSVQGKKLEFMDKTILNDAINNGAAFVLEGLDILDANINEFNARIDASMPCVMSTAVAFLSQKSNEAYEGHFDTDDVLVVQLSGRKTWQLFTPQARRFEEIEDMSDEELGPVQHEVTLRPGDALYVRSGVPHRCLTPTEHSLHLSFDLVDQSPTTGEIAAEASTHYDKETEDSYASMEAVIGRYSNIIGDPDFVTAFSEAVDIKASEIRKFRENIGRSAIVRSLNKFK